MSWRKQLLRGRGESGDLDQSDSPGGTKDTEKDALSCQRAKTDQLRREARLWESGDQVQHQSHPVGAKMRELCRVGTFRGLRFSAEDSVASVDRLPAVLGRSLAGCLGRAPSVAAGVLRHLHCSARSHPAYSPAGRTPAEITPHPHRLPRTGRARTAGAGGEVSEAAAVSEVAVPGTPPELLEVEERGAGDTKEAGGGARETRAAGT
ncbi:hypothetical protein NDU88_006698 [Pleurodeles waltl]|uniref:Uncharacterized protein n=1 Tax=Pleurodeles waltl TaxID=8319 RepID=A0AAV7QIM8_PLEWA|nr:hypothetical protein NDU88_006698 [Pleurodeles waltl]